MAIPNSEVRYHRNPIDRLRKSHQNGSEGVTGSTTPVPGCSHAPRRACTRRGDPPGLEERRRVASSRSSADAGTPLFCGWPVNTAGLDKCQ
jgi:hypothetical protein